MLKVPDQRTQRLLALAQFIEESDDFDMNDWDKCICGQLGKMHGMPVWDKDMATRFLGLTGSETTKLFVPCLSPGGYTKITREVAARTLRHFAVTGDIEFNVGESD